METKTHKETTTIVVNELVSEWVSGQSEMSSNDGSQSCPFPMTTTTGGLGDFFANTDDRWRTWQRTLRSRSNRWNQHRCLIDVPRHPNNLLPVLGVEGWQRKKEQELRRSVSSRKPGSHNQLEIQLQGFSSNGLFAGKEKPWGVKDYLPECLDRNESNGQS